MPHPSRPSSCLLFNLPSHFQPTSHARFFVQIFQPQGTPLKFKPHATLFHVFVTLTIRFSCLEWPIPLSPSWRDLSQFINEFILCCRWWLSQSPKVTILSMVTPLCLVHDLLSHQSFLTSGLAKSQVERPLQEGRCTTSPPSFGIHREQCLTTCGRLLAEDRGRDCGPARY